MGNFHSLLTRHVIRKWSVSCDFWAGQIPVQMWQFTCQRKEDANMKAQVAEWLEKHGFGCAAHVVRMYGREEMPSRSVDWMDVRAYLCCLMPPLESHGDREEISNIILALNLKGASL